jgi:hypothetical protein
VTEVAFAEYNDVVKAFPADRTDQPFSISILPRRGWCGRLVPDAHGAQSAGDDAAIDASRLFVMASDGRVEEHPL